MREKKGRREFQFLWFTSGTFLSDDVQAKQSVLRTSVSFFVAYEERRKKK
jgi:hypothetical protein